MVDVVALVYLASVLPFYSSTAFQLAAAVPARSSLGAGRLSLFLELNSRGWRDNIEVSVVVPK